MNLLLAPLSKAASQRVPLVSLDNIKIPLETAMEERNTPDPDSCLCPNLCAELFLFVDNPHPKNYQMSGIDAFLKRTKLYHQYLSALR